MRSRTSRLGGSRAVAREGNRDGDDDDEKVAAALAEIGFCAVIDNIADIIIEADGASGEGA